MSNQQTHRRTATTKPKRFSTTADWLLVDVKDQDLFEQRLAEIRRDDHVQAIPNRIWLSHHWDGLRSERCVDIAGHAVCRRCVVLHPVAFVMAVTFVLGFNLWPTAADPAMIWLLSLPATVAFVGEAVKLFRYSPRWQAITTAMAGLAFGRALGYELLDRWHPFFWQPIAVFGGIWFFASVYGHVQTSKIR